MEAFDQIVRELRSEYELRYGFAVLDLAARETPRWLVVAGTVLTPDQRDEVLRRVGEAAGKPVVSRIRVLSDPRTSAEGWAAVKTPLAEIKSRPVSQRLQNDRVLRRLRADQAGKGELLRVLLRRDDQLLVQTHALTLGWINRADVVLKKAPMDAAWRAGRLALPGKLLAVKAPGARALRAAEAFLGTPYLLGGKSPAGIDCSGLAQLAYARAFGVILPRHSWDQRKIGQAVELDAAGPGDLAFLVNRQSGTKHVGLLDIEEGERFLLHSSGAAGKVVRQPLAQALERYELVEVRRLIKK